MNLFSKSGILFLNKNTLRLVEVHGDTESEIKFEGNWSASDISNTIGYLKSRFKIGSLRVLLSDELLYIATISINSDRVGKDIKSDILEKVLAVFPEDKDNLIWDYKLSFVEDNTNNYQVVGVAKSFIQSITGIIEQNNITIDNIEPLSYSLARVVPNSNESAVILHTDDLGMYYVLVKNRSVLFSRYFDNADDSYESFENFINFVKEKFLENTNNGKSIELKIFNSSPLLIPAHVKGVSMHEVKINVDPYISLFKKLSIKGRDEEVLNIDIHDVKLSSNKSEQTHHENHEPRKIGFLKIDRLTIMIVVLVIMMFFAGYMLFGYLNRSTHEQPQPTEMQQILN